MTQATPPSFTLAERLEFGNLTIKEVCELKSRSNPGFYQDLAAGLVTVRKIGKKSVIPGPVARAYIEGRALPL